MTAMAAAHGDRLSATDTAFLLQEGRTSHMHIGAVAVLEGPAPSYEELVAHVAARLHHVPRYRQRLATPPWQTGRPLWVDDTSFTLAYHVRRTALPAPGSDDQLRALAAQVHSEPLDRARPLWELHLVEGVSDGRFAILFKTHHALVDGIATVGLAAMLFDLDPVPAPEDPQPWQPRPEPTPAALAARGLRGLAKAPAALAGAAAGAVTRPADAVATLRQAADGLGAVARVGLNRAPPSPFNVPIGPHRRLCFVHNRVDDFKAVKRALGGTVNDVVLAVVAGALRTWLRDHGTPTDGLALQALVPVSIRRSRHDELGNRLALVRAPLPVSVADPVERLAAVRTAMRELKASRMVHGTEVVAGIESLVPPALLAQLSRLQFSSRLFNLLVTNVPGPPRPIYVLGREVCDLYPIAFLARRHALAIAIVSYNGRMDFGVLGDATAMADIDAVGAALEGALGELLRAAGSAVPAAL
jgi:diacylglycerol O-acyltransferase / wax synthase